MNTGIFRCGECSTYFAETVPPPWLEYWPSHCGEHAPLQYTVGSVAVEMRVAEALMSGGRSSPPVALLEPEPALPGWVNCPFETQCRTRHTRPRRSKTKVALVGLAVFATKAMPLTIVVPTALLAY